MKKKIIYSYLAAIIFLGILVNFNTIIEIPKGTDYIGHIYAVRALSQGYKIPNILTYPLSLDVSESLIVTLTGLDEILTLKFVHVILVSLVILSFYNLGRTYNEKSGIILATFLSFFFSWSMWSGLGFIYPSTFILLLLPNIFLNILKENKKGLVIWLLVSLIIYKYCLPLIILTIILYYAFNYSIKKDKKAIPFFIIILLIFLCMIFFPIKIFVFASSLTSEELELFNTKIIDIISLSFFSIFGLVIFMKYYKNEKMKKLFGLGFSSIICFLIVFLSLPDTLVKRSVSIFIIGLYILSTIYIGNKNIHKHIKIIFVFYLFVFLLPITVNSIESTKNIYTQEEWEAITWARENMPIGYYLISDPNTARLSKLGNAIIPQSFNINQYSKNVEFIFSKDDFTENDFTYFDNLLKEPPSDEYYIDKLDERKLYIILEPFTRNWLEANVKNITFPEPWYNFTGFKKIENSRKFMKIYEKNFIYIYEYLP